MRLAQHQRRWPPIAAEAVGGCICQVGRGVASHLHLLTICMYAARHGVTIACQLMRLHIN
jgi:hypothetical protein